MAIVMICVGQMAFAATAPKPTPPETSKEKAKDVITQPLNDLNVAQPEIPAILLRAKSTPYDAPSGGDCRALNSEIGDLDKALGPDLDLAKGNKSVAKRVSDMTFDLARGAVSGLIPFRGVVRYVTGAEKRAREINEALIAGTVRRSYLKGYGEMLGCDYPASPKR
jgi:hypothetical protein